VTRPKDELISQKDSRYSFFLTQSNHYPLSPVFRCKISLDTKKQPPYTPTAIKGSSYQFNMDMNAGTVVSGSESVGEAGERTFAELLRVASGVVSRAEVLCFDDFAIRRIGPLL
jgi:hypothetical protein